MPETTVDRVVAHCSMTNPHTTHEWRGFGDSDPVICLGIPEPVDMVNHPPHYKGPIHVACGQPIECIDVIRPMPLSVGNAVKYVWRAGKKVIDRTAREAEIEDMRKAIWYLQDRIDELERESNE